ncbi:MAG: DHH family phosphoesterase [Thermoplasmata archaeon]|nr:MAG: DHH family phosphoesterase [Thermoplasmata archaeon]
MKNVNDIPKGLVKKLKIAREIVLNEKDTIRLISHYDADGICAAGILCHTLLRQGLKFHVTLTRSLKDEFVDILKKEDYPVTIFCDMGSGHLDALKEFKNKVIILDHHTAQSNSDEPLLINPHFYGMDGTYDICGSSLAFMFACVINEKNWDLSALALAGIIGDKQHLDGLSGYNAHLFEMAKDKGIVDERKMLKFSSNLVKNALLEDLDPFIKGMTGREDRILEFIRNMKLDSDIKFEDLDEEQMRLLLSAIIIRLLAQKVRPEIAEGVITKKYWIWKMNLYASDLSNFINSCGRMDNMGTGLALCLGEEMALKKAIKLRATYKDELRFGLLKLEEEGAHDMQNIQFFYNDNSSLAGAYAGLGMMYLFNSEKPTFALSVEEEKTKVSCRGTKYLVSKGLDLARACRDSANEVGGRGGGHPVASGATIPKGKEEAFLKHVDEIVGKQLQGADDTPGNSV